MAGGDDVLVGTQVTDGSGNYAFVDLEPGRYFVEQAPVTGQVQRPSETLKTVDISEADSEGVGVIVIDNFFDNSATLTANAGTPTVASSTATTGSNTLGDERAIVVNYLAGPNNLEVQVNGGILSAKPGAGTSGNVILTYDGVDGNPTTIDHSQLNVDLTSGGGQAFQFLAGATLVGNTLTFDVFSGATDFSTLTINIPQTGGGLATEVLILRFADFTVGGGAGADFSNATALRIQLNITAANDAQVDLTQTIAPFVSTENFANLNPMSIGDQIWRDLNNDGVFDLSENGIAGVSVELYEDTNSNGVYDDGVDTLVATTVTDANGQYLFEDLLPGDYFAVIPLSNFAAAGPLEGHVASSIVDPPNNDSNNLNKGVFLGGVGVVSSGILTLVAGGEPTDDGDSDPNTNLTLDFGFVPEFDLAITKQAHAPTVTAGQQVTYTLQVTNNGPGPAENVIVVDDLPDFMTIVSVTADPDGTVTLTGDSAGEVEVTYASLGSGEVRTITIIASIPAAHAATTEVPNIATVVGDGTELDDDNNQDSVNIDIDREAILQIVKTDTPDPSVVGQQLTYQIIVTNTGPSTATNLQILDTLPVGLDFVSVDSSAGTAGFAGGLITVDVASLNVGDSVTVDIVTTILSTFAGSTIANTATAEADEAQLVSADAETTINPEIDLSITKSDSADPISQGAELTYTLTVRNDGPSQATNVEVVDTLPTGVTYVSASGPGGSTITPPGVGEQDVLTELGDLAAGAEVTITIIVTVNQNATGTLNNTAIVRSTESLAGFDSDPTNNTTSETTDTQRLIDLAVTKIDSATLLDPIQPGGPITYTITATNNGPSNAIGVVVVDNIPDGIQVTQASIGVTNVSIPASAADTNPANPDDLIFNVGNLASGESVIITVIANVLPAFRDDLVNTVVISTTDDTATDTDPTNNTATVTSPLSPEVDLAVVKSTPSGATVVAGNALVYHIDVTNNGPSTATGVTLSDTLPGGLTFVSVTTQQGTVGHAGGVISGNLGSIAPGQTVRVTVNTTVDPGARGSLVNTAIVSSSSAFHGSPGPAPLTSRSARPAIASSAFRLPFRCRRSAPVKSSLRHGRTPAASSAFGSGMPAEARLPASTSAAISRTSAHSTSGAAMPSSRRPASIRAARAASPASAASASWNTSKRAPSATALRTSAAVSAVPRGYSSASLSIS